MPAGTVFLIDLLNAIEPFLVERLLLREPGRLPEQRQFVRLADVRQDRVQRVVILGRNRIVLVIVAARTGHRQSEQASRDRIDAIVHGLGIAVRKFAPEAQEAERGQMPRLGLRHAIGRELIKHELIVRQIFVQRAGSPSRDRCTTRDSAARR